MSKLLVVVVAILLLTLSSAAQGHQERWYTGGNLHRASAAEWNSSSHANRLATSADFVASIMGTDAVRRETRGDINRLRPRAERMKSCIDDALAGNNSRTIRVSEIGAACAVLLGYT